MAVNNAADRSVEAITVHQQISLRPEMYIGSTSKVKTHTFINGTYMEVEYVPGLLKLIEEIVDNSVDVSIATGYRYGTKIDIEITGESVKVTDNGTGISVRETVNTRGEPVWEPVLAWGEPQSSSNYKDDSNRKTFGTNGVGSTVVNIFSKYFMGVTCDGNKKLVYINSKENVEDPIGKEEVKIEEPTKNSFTTVYFEPKMARFEEDTIEEVYVSLIQERVERIALAHPQIEFTVNGRKVRYIDKMKYLGKYSDAFTVEETTNTLVGICLCEEEEFRHVSVVNGMSLANGGNQVDFIMGKICDAMRPLIKKKYKVDILPNQIKQKMILVNVIKNFNNMKFDSQTKVKLTNSREEIAGYFSDFDFDKFAKKVMKNEYLIDTIVHSQVQKLKAKERREQERLQREVSKNKVAKHVAPNSRQKTGNVLYMVEGDSAKVNFMQTRDRPTQGVYPLRGKFLNISKKSKSDILKNDAVKDIMSILGLTLDGTVPDTLGHGYDKIFITADADIDGYCIAAQIMNFLKLWPDLYHRGMVYLLRTPIMVVKKGNTTVQVFYTLEDYAQYTLKAGEHIKYLKGLGTLTVDEYREYVTENPRIEQVSMDSDSEHCLHIAFSEDRALRKEWLGV